MKPDFLNDKDKINKASEEDVLKGLEKVNAQNLELRKSFKHPNDCNSASPEFIKKMVKDSIPEIREEMINKWNKLAMFLWHQKLTNEAQEFRLFLNDDDTFYIHPFGVDGDTLDGKLF